MSPQAAPDLRDIHLPPEPGWWPPAPGWWLLLLLVLLAALGWLAWRRRGRRLAVWRDAERQLAAIGRDAQRVEPRLTLQRLSAWLRQCSLAGGNAAEVAGLHGEAWLTWLDGRLGGAEFRSGSGRILADGHYRPRLDATDLDALLALCRRWLRAQQGRAG